MKMRACLAFAFGLLVITDAGLALGKGDDKPKKGRSEEAKEAKEAAKDERKERREADKADGRRDWNPPGLGRPVKNLDDLIRTRAARREAHRNEVRDRLKGALKYPDVHKELERHARFEARIDVLEAKAREAEKTELLGRLAELRRKEDERHAKNLEKLAKAGAK